mgnify:CR=1 FL=1
MHSHDFSILQFKLEFLYVSTVDISHTSVRLQCCFSVCGQFDRCRHTVRTVLKVSSDAVIVYVDLWIMLCLQSFGENDVVSWVFKIVFDDIMNDEEVLNPNCLEDSQRRGWFLSTFKTFDCAVQSPYDVFDFNFKLWTWISCSCHLHTHKLDRPCMLQ